MKIGQAAIVKEFKNQSGGGDWQRYVAPNGEYFVMLLMGTVKLETVKEFSLDKTLESMGWKYVGEQAKPNIEENSAVRS